MQHGEDLAERILDVLFSLGTSQDNFAGDEDQKNDFRIVHFVDKAWKELRLIPRELLVVPRA